MNPLKTLLTMLNNGYSSQELDKIYKLQSLFTSIEDELFVMERQKNELIHIKNTYCFIILENNASKMKVSFDVRLIPDIVANITRKLLEIEPRMIVMESYMKDTDNNRLIFGQQSINEFLTFRSSDIKTLNSKEEFLN